MLKTSASAKPDLAEVQYEPCEPTSKEHSKTTAVASNREESAN
jgi:hypothetical protein